MSATTNLQSNRLVQAFADLRASGRKTVLPFVTAGYPSLETTGAILRKLDTLGVRVCELGFPFTDPVADGPVIQASYTAALESGVKVGAIFDTVARFRKAGGKLAVVGMVSYSIVYRYGPDRFVRDAAASGFDGLIVPDLPLDESADMEALAAGGGLALVQLIAPTTPPERQVEIARRSRGFVYYISVSGITGERTQLPPATVEAVGELRTHTDTPVCVGFGVSGPEIVANVCRTADGAIVGSAIVHRITDHKSDPPERIAEVVGEFVADLLAPLK